MKIEKYIFLVGLIFLFLIIIVIEEYEETKFIQEKEMALKYSIESKNVTYKTQRIKSEEIKEYPKEEVISKYKEYDVCAKLEIPKIKLETYVLSNHSISALGISVTKFWGPNPNEIGNLCITGHNFINENMFHNLKKLSIGDTFFLIDNKIGKLEYEIYDTFEVLPTNVECLSQETNGRREVTLITCTNDSKKRIIIKSKEKIY